MTDLFARKVLEDREGNLWVGANGGLDRFRHRNVTFFSMEPGTHGYSLVAGVRGDVWAWPFALSHRGGRGVRVQDGKLVNGGPQNLEMAYHNPDGTMLLAKEGFLCSWNKKRFTQLASPMPHPQVTALTRDSAGTLWISDMKGGIFSQAKDGRWVHIDVVQGNPTAKANSMFADGDGRVWFSFASFVAVVDQGKSRTFAVEAGPPLGRFRVITGCEKQVWVSGSSGLAFFQSDRFHELLDSEGHSFGPVGDFIATCKSGLWLAIGQNITHIPEEEVRFALANHNHGVGHEVFDLVSDLPESLQRYSSGVHDVIQTDDGLLWFATHNGVV